MVQVREAEMSESLGLAGDGDEVELVQDVESSFGIKFLREEIEKCTTVGEMFAILQGKLSAHKAGQGCASAMAFYRLRRVLTELSPDAKLRPSTKLSELGFTAKALFRYIGRRSEFRLPKLRLSHVGAVGAISVLAGLTGLIVSLSKSGWWVASLALIAVGSAIVYFFDSGRVPRGCETLGDLANKVAGLNFEKLLEHGARPRSKDIWSALVEVLSEHSGLLKSEIGSETRFLAKRIRAA